MNTRDYSFQGKISTYLRAGIGLVLFLSLSLGSFPVQADSQSTSSTRHEVTLAPVDTPNQTAQRQYVLESAVDKHVSPSDSILGLAGIHSNDPRDLKLLVISADGLEAFDYTAILAFLDQIGIPYDVLIAKDTTLTAEMLSEGTHGYYSGIILVTGNLLYFDGISYLYAFTQEEWDILWTYEAEYGVRQLTCYLAPTGYIDYGLTYAGEMDTTNNPLQVTLTPDGQQLYNYLNPNNPITIEYAWVYLATIFDPLTTTALITYGNYAISSIHTYPDGRQNLAVTVANAPFRVHSQLLSYGNINWLTNGLFLGERHVNITPQIDDLLIDDDIWDTQAMTDTTGLTYRITGQDFMNIIAWQTSTSGNCINLQPDPQAGKDATIRQDNPDNNYGANSVLATASGTAKKGIKLARSLLQFDLGSLPVDPTSVSLHLYLSSNTGSKLDIVEAHALTRAWVEGTNGKNKGVTWNRYDGRNSRYTWSNPGGDYVPDIAGSFQANGTGWKTMDLTTLARTWITNPAQNNGIILLSPPRSGNNEKQYYSSDSPTTALRPYLSVCYSSNTSTTPDLTLEMAFNGEGAAGIYTPDTLTPIVISNNGYFSWVNHTYYHQNLDTITYEGAWNELSQNNAAATTLGLINYVIDPMVQPDISGLSNTEFQRAATDFGIRFLISDTSRQNWGNPTPNTGILLPSGLLVIPRRPTNLFYNLTTPEQFVSEYNCYYGPTGTCAHGQWRYWDHDLTYSEILDKESDMWLQYLLNWDLDPLMFHQPNLRAYYGVDTLFTDLLNATLAKYNLVYNLKIRSLTQHEIGGLMYQRMAYNDSDVTAVLYPGSHIQLNVVNPATIPITGNACGSAVEIYGGQTISYIDLAAGGTVNIPLSCTP